MSQRWRHGSVSTGAPRRALSGREAAQQSPQVGDLIPIDILAPRWLEHLGRGADANFEAAVVMSCTVPTASSSDRTWRHSMFELVGWAKIRSSVSR